MFVYQKSGQSYKAQELGYVLVGSQKYCLRRCSPAFCPSMAPLTATVKGAQSQANALLRSSSLLEDVCPRPAHVHLKTHSPTMVQPPTLAVIPIFLCQKEKNKQTWKP